MIKYNKERKSYLRKNIIDPDEIFLDSKNLPQFNTQQFEGRLEQPINRKSVILMGIVFLSIAAVFSGRLWILQIARGENLKERSENNRLQHTPIISVRGIIYDKNNNKLVWNTIEEGLIIPTRSYISLDGFSHILGHVSYPLKDASGFYFQENFVGKDGVEKVYDDILSGENGIKLTEINAIGEIQSENTIEPPKDGNDLMLTIDIRVQENLYKFIEQFSKDHGFSGGGGVIMDVKSGEILALTSFPEYSSAIVSRGTNRDLVTNYVEDTRKPFLNRVVGGLYTPGSIVKPYIAFGALSEYIIDPDKKILSSGSISIQNPYYPELKSVFMDWKAHGWVNMREAIAVSSNVYFYSIGGGYEDQKGLGISNIEKYVRMFGLGEKTNIDLLGEKAGSIPSPAWKSETFNGEPWRVGDTYNTAIGQYGFQVTPIQMVRAVSAIANGGILVLPHLNKNIGSNIRKTISIEYGDLKVIQEGMRMVVKEGTASTLNMQSVSVAAKTGTAELGAAKKYVNSWSTGYFPYENPRYAFVVVMEKGSRENLIGASAVIRSMLEWMTINTPEYIQQNKK